MLLLTKLFEVLQKGRMLQRSLTNTASHVSLRDELCSINLIALLNATASSPASTLPSPQTNLRAEKCRLRSDWLS